VSSFLRLTVLPEFEVRQRMKVSPRLVAANHVLELSSQELQQAIATELHDNPALELVEVVSTCRVCGTELHDSICPGCIQRQKTKSQTSEREGDKSTYDDVSYSRLRGPDEDVFDPLTGVAAKEIGRDTDD
jgi:DNA-directed RNA polymerase specialized sigma54-like protein